jgi:5-(carboxyamino)imidazole ribonucleotide synthase
MFNILGPKNYVGPYAIAGLRRLFSIPRLKLHFYGKKITNPRRKLGHVTLVGTSIEETLDRANSARKTIKVLGIGNRKGELD